MIMNTGCVIRKEVLVTVDESLRPELPLIEYIDWRSIMPDKDDPMYPAWEKAFRTFLLNEIRYNRYIEQVEAIWTVDEEKDE